jgi:membrane protease YdiL (CAAX protease family)
VLAVHAGSGLQPLLFPVGWGILATVAAAWTGVIAGAVLYPAGVRAGTLRTMLGLFLLASILGPMVAAGSLPGFPQALWAVGIPVMALARLWQVACHRYRWLEDPEPPPSRGDELDAVVWLFLGLTLVTPLVAQVIEFSGLGGKAASGLVLLCLMPLALGAASLWLRSPEAGNVRGLMAGAVAGVGLLALNLAYVALSGWLGWMEPLRPEGAGELLRLLADQPWAIVAGGVLTATVVPVGEELFFRGLLFPCLRASSGEGQAYVVSSLAFALVHPLAHAPFTLVFGLAAAWLYVRWGGLAAPVAAHLVCNGAILMTSLLR